MCVCVYIYIHTHTYTYIYIYIHKHTHTHTHTQGVPKLVIKNYGEITQSTNLTVYENGEWKSRTNRELEEMSKGENG